MKRIVFAALSILALGCTIGYTTTYRTPTQMAWCCAEDPPCPVVYCAAPETKR